MPLSKIGPGYPRAIAHEAIAAASDIVRGFYEYWDAKRGVRMAPARGDLSPVEMKRWLAGISIIDVVSFPDRLVYRLVGTQNVEARGEDPTGRTVTEAYFGRSIDDILENYRIVIEERKAVLDWDRTPSRDRWRREHLTLLLPLSSDGFAVDKVIVFCEYAPRRGDLDRS